MDEAVVELQQLFASCFGRPLFGLSAEELAASTDACFHAQALLDGLTVAHVREVDGRGLARQRAASSTKAWLVERERIGPGAAARLVRLAKALDRDAGLHPEPGPGHDTATATDPDPEPGAEQGADPGAGADPAWISDPDPDADPFRLPPGVRSARDALNAGLVNLEQADAISASLKDLPLQYRAAAETLLVGDAQQFGPVILRQLGHIVLRRVAPDKADHLEGEALRRNEQRTYRQRGLHLGRTNDGGIRLYGTFDSTAAAIINAVIDPLCSPQVTGGDDERSYPQRRADALTDAFQFALNNQNLPHHGGERTQVVVTVGLKDLHAQIGTATLDDGTPMSATQARRLACCAGIIPAVLGSHGQVLDLGRERRLFTGAARRALNLRDRGCTFPHCDRPPNWAEGHHLVSWLDGGTTCLSNGALLCRHHHGVVHDGAWEVRINPDDGLPDFIPPAFIDSHRRPRRNPYHKRP